ncbi:MAG TPA: hypothetical protein VFV53_10135 [Candidatus Limnocylindrales bacterium]|nr:hypothetical protein [Candidatus Limnocylindrales bacterium]
MPIRPACRLAALLAAASLVGGCIGGDATPSPLASSGSSPSPGAGSSPSPAADAIEVYRAIAADVVAIRGLDAPDRIDPRVIDADELRANLEADFEKSNPAAQILIGERVYKALGLLPEDASLEQIYLDLQGSQVIGYYDPAVDELFIVSRSGSLGAIERVTYAHEFTHELQDEAFDLESLGLEDAFDEGDRALGILGLVEGDAVSAQTTWMIEHLSPAELGEVAAAGADPEMLAILARTPAILLETSLFPYQAGAAFVSTLLGGGGYDAVNAAYDRLPESTEQVLHPEKYVAGEAPVDVEVPPDLAATFGAGWSLDAQDTLGELQLRIWLREGGLKGDVARLAAEGWGGDRAALLSVEGTGDVVVLVTEWDTTADAAEFRSAAADAVAGLGLEAVIVANDRRVVLAIGAAAPASIRSILDGLAGTPTR